jgi:hypothetical protein
VLCRAATTGDKVDAEHLTESAGWQTLLAILESYGERPLKRSFSTENEASNADSPSESLAKRFKQAASLER